jgi:phage terminase large subunit
MLRGVQRPLRIPCARETMQSIRESVHQLLEDQITRLGYQRKYEVQKSEIIGHNGTAS